jgi:putative sigma-54 modulation protein
MWVTIHGRGLADAAVRERIERRLSFALSRCGQQVVRVSVHLADVNGPRGGVDKQCRVTVELAGLGRVMIEDLDVSLNAAIDRAADRVGRAVRRRLQLVRTSAPSPPLNE